VGSIPETDLARIARWVDGRNEQMPTHVRHEIRIEMDVAPTSVTIFECRPPWQPEHRPDWTRQPVARLHYTKARREWSLYSTDRNLEFHRYDQAAATATVERLLTEIDADPSCTFWG
jgi:hypothetical protein